MSISAISSLLLSLTTLLSGLSGSLSVVPTTQVAQVSGSQKTVLQPSDFVYQGYYDIQTDGANTTYASGLTHRYVNGQLRLLTRAGRLHEFALPSTYGSKITSITNSWGIGSVSGDHTGIWWDEAKQRLWVTASIDYGSSGTYYPTRISTISLNSDGTVSNAKTVSLEGVTSKRVYGGVQPVPAWAQTQLGCGPYVVGWGGYTSLVASLSRGVMGPSLICIPDIASYADGAIIPASAFKVLLDTPTSRGVRKTFPLNYFDGAPEWLTYPPTAPPDPRSNWLSPNPSGQGWFVWGDSYYNNGMWIDTPTKQGFVAIAALCKGKCWYQDSTLNYDARTEEMHIWDVNTLGNGILTRPTSMAELAVPRGRNCVWSGNTPQCNISGATFDPVSGNLYMVGYPLGPDINTGRIYVYKLTNGGGASVPTTPTTPIPTATDATVSSWSAWSDTSSWTTCSSGTQTKTQIRTRTVVTAAINGGNTPTLSETQTVSQSCMSTATTTNTNIANVPSGYTLCTTEGNVCTFSGIKSVAYGAAGKFVYATSTNSISCSNSVFGDPINGTPKYCSTKDTVTTSTPTPVNATVSAWSAWSDTSSWTTCSAGTQTKTQQRTRTVVTPATNGGTTPSLSETQTVSQSCTSTTPTTGKLTQDLRIGSRGTQVTLLQNFLIKKGYLKSGLNTGYFGYSTYSAVQKYQRANGISATGFVGTQTRVKINSEI